MCRLLLTVAVLPMLWCCLGCASVGLASSDWIANQGGIDPGPGQARAERAIASLWGNCEGRRVAIRVLANDAAVAFSWPNGDVFVSRGLVKLLDDAELTAAVAHELGHLLGDGHLHAVVSLNGTRANLDLEERADAFGVELLRSRRLPTAPMRGMLTKLASSRSLPPECVPAIEHRIRLLGE
jgi:hypothetical protein